VKYFVFFNLVFVLATASLAAPATQIMSREGTSVMLYQLAQDKGFKWEKLLAELRSEISVIKYEKAKAAFETQQSGSLTSQLLTSRDALRFDYRFKYSLLRNFSKESSLQINFDTIDATNTTRDFATRLIDVESRFALGNWDWQVNVGPGKILHQDELSPLNNTVYLRPESGVKASTRVGKMDFSAGYVARQVAASGLIGVNELTSTLGFDFGQSYFFLRPHYVYVDGGGRDVLLEAGLDCGGTSLVWGSGGQNQYLGLIQKIGSWLELSYKTVGPDYRSSLCQNEFVLLNYFDRYVVDGSADLGAKITHKFDDQLSLELKVDNVVGQNEYLAWQAGVGYENLDIIYQVCGGVSLVGVGLSCSL